MKTIFATSLLCGVLPSVLLAQEVDLRSADEFISVEGEIVDFNGVMLRVQTSVGTVSVPASEVICYGEGCLEILASNNFGLTAEAFEGVEASEQSAVTARADDLTVGFASNRISTLYRTGRRCICRDRTIRREHCDLSHRRYRDGERR